LRGFPDMTPQQSPQTVPAAALLVEYLEREGVEYVFAVPGAPLNPLFQALHRSSIRTVLAKHEAGAAFMAYGYARVTGRLGVCAGTAGPGTTNLVTGAAAALWDGVPLLLLTGQVPMRFFGMGALQEFTHETVSSTDLMSEVTKFSTMVATPQHIGRMMRKALRAAFSGKKGPVALNIPADVLGAPAVRDELLPDDYRVPQRAFDRLMLQRISRRVLEARRPAILAGYGVVASKGETELRLLAEELSIPVATTQSGKGGFPERHPLSLGVYGFAGTPRALEYVREHADLVIVFGSSLGQLQTGNFGDALSRRALVQIDVDGELIGRNFPVDIGMVGDAQVVLKELRFQLRRDWNDDAEAARAERDAALEEMRARVPWSLREERLTSDAMPLLPQRVIHELQRALPEDAVVLWDSGSHAIWGLHYFRASNALQFVHSGTFAAMGHSIAAAVGARLGAPEHAVVCVTGDGCMMMHGLEIATAVNCRAPAVWVVLNNEGMRMVEQGQRALFGEAYLWQFSRVDFAALARSIGAEGFTVQRPEDLGPALEAALACGRPAVVDCWVDPDELPPAFTNANT
jgi:acetolactate synthase-1/2/3 large subunit